MTVTNFTEDGGEYYVDLIVDGTRFTFIFVRRGSNGAAVKSMMVNGFTLATGDARTKAEAFGEAKRYLLECIDDIEDVYLPRSATVVFNE